MSFLRSLMTDLRERQVLPAVLLLLVLAIAIPVLGPKVLSNSAPPGPVTVPPVATAPPKGTLAPDQELLTVQTPPAQTYVTYKGTEQDPFLTASSPTPHPSAPSSKSAGSVGKPKSKPAGGTSPASHSGSGPHTTVTAPTQHSGGSGAKGSGAPHPAPSSLAKDQVYTVNVTTGYGSQSETLQNVERLTPLPANVAAEVVYLGVMKGGKSAAFLLTGSVSAKASVAGSVTCEPSAADCEVVELPVGAQLTLTPTSSTSGAAIFTLKLTAIGASTLGSHSAAMQAREAAAPAGEAILAASISPVLASFFYDSNTGALVYEPQSSVGTSGASGSTGGSGASGATGASG
jgi:hypothetical protein